MVLGAVHPKLAFAGPNAGDAFYSGFAQFNGTITFNWTFLDTGAITRTHATSTTNPTQFLTPVTASVGALCDVRVVVSARSGQGTLRFAGAVIAPSALGPTAWAPLTAEGVKLEGVISEAEGGGTSARLNATFSIEIRNRATQQVISRAGSLALEVAVD